MVERVPFSAGSPEPLCISNKTVLLYLRNRTRVMVSNGACGILREDRVVLLSNYALFVGEYSRSVEVLSFVCSARVSCRTARGFRPSFFGFVLRRPIRQRARRDVSAVVTCVRVLSALRGSIRGRFEPLVTAGLLEYVVLGVCSGLGEGNGLSSNAFRAHGRRVCSGFVSLVVRGTGERERISCCTSGLYVSTHRLDDVAGSIANRAPGRAVSRFLVARVGLVLAFSRVDVRRVTSCLRFPSRSCFKEFFGQFAKVSPRSCHGGRVAVW